MERRGLLCSQPDDMKRCELSQGPYIRIGASLRQQCHANGFAQRHRCRMQGRETVLCPRHGVCAGIEQCLDDATSVRLHGRKVKECDTVLPPRHGIGPCGQPCAHVGRRARPEEAPGVPVGGPGRRSGEGEHQQNGADGEASVAPSTQFRTGRHQSGISHALNDDRRCVIRNAIGRRRRCSDPRLRHGRRW